MFDALTSTFRLSCPRHGQTSVRLSRFRRLDELPGPHHPAVFRVVFACGCGEEHPALVAHDELELAELAAQRIKAGQWPWSFFCWPEDRPRPVFPSAFRLLAESGPGGRVAVAVRCPACGRVSLNLVTREHIDLPFVNDREIGVVGHLFDADAAATLDAFTAELYSESFDARRLTLE